MEMIKLSLIILVTIILVSTSCGSKSEAILYKKEYSEDEKIALVESLSFGSGFYPQGSVGERMVALEELKYNPQSANGWRVQGIPYLKRGFAYEAAKYYSKTIEFDSQEWLGYKANCWLYFYRDYETAIRELDTYDAYTPNFVDYPMATSVDYMRGIAYLRLGKLDKALEYLGKHMKEEKSNVGADYIEPKDYLMLGVAYYESGDFTKALEVFDEGLLYNGNNADLYFHNALVAAKMKDEVKAKSYLDKAEYLIANGGKNIVPYYEEFYAVYQQDVDRLRKELLN